MSAPADKTPLGALLAPRSIAVVGASPDPHKPSGMVLGFLGRSAYPGAIYPVNPKYAEVDRWACYPSLSAVPTPPDLAVVTTPTEGVLPVLEECVATGVPAALVMSGGFGEGATGPAGAARKDRLTALVRESGLRVLGPNTVGLVNFGFGLPLTFADWYGRDLGLRDKVAVLTQSGSVGGLIFSLIQGSGVGVNYWIGLGNEVDLEAADFIRHFAGAEDVDTVVCFLEGLSDGCRFVDAAEALRAAGKSLVVVKAGRSAASQRSTLSHTGKLSTTGQRYSAVLAEIGAVEATSLRELAGIVQLLARPRRTTTAAPRNSIGIISASGGMCSLLADHAADAGLDLPELSAATQNALAAVIPEFGSTQNPVDLSANVVGRQAILDGTFDVLRGNEEVATWLVFGRPILDRYHRAIAAAAPSFKADVVVCSGVPVAAETMASLRGAGVPVLEDPEFCIRAIGRLAGRRTRPAALPVGDRSRLRRRLGTSIAAGARVHEALRSHGLPMPDSRFVASPEEARDLGLRFPVAVKSAVAEIPHKTEAGCVILGVADPAALAQAVARVIANIRRAAPDAAPLVEIQEMAAPGREVILTITQDRDFGPLGIVGLGGTAAELLADTEALLVPATAEAFTDALPRLKGWPLLAGHRGRPAADIAALAELWTALSRFYRAEGWVGEIELNPVIVGDAGEGVAVVDSLLTLAE